MFMRGTRKVCHSLYVAGKDGVESDGGLFDTVVSLACPCEHTTDEFVIADGEHDYDTYKKAVDSVIDALESGDEVLVNCHAGMSRSVSACVAAQVCHYDMEYIEALQNARIEHRNPTPPLMKSSEKYIRENYDYKERIAVNKKIEDEVVDIYAQLQESLESDDEFEQTDRFMIHFQDIIQKRFGEG